jgi:hypothetical protein
VTGTLPNTLDLPAELAELQRHTFAYFVHEADPATGLVRDNSRYGAPSSIAAVGLGLACWPIAVERRFVTRDEAVERTLATLKFFERCPKGGEPDAAGYRGFFYHFLHLTTGRRAHGCELSTMDTAILLAGALTAAAYLDGADPREAEIRAIADSLYRAAEWEWALDGELTVRHGWTPERGFLPWRWQGYNEALLLYALGLGSPTHPLPAESYGAWAATYEWRRVYGIEHLFGGPLFLHQISHLWIDFRGIQDAFMRERGIDYFENSRRATLVQQRYAERNPSRFRGYSRDIWGITASDGPGPAVRRIGGRVRHFFDYRARGVPNAFAMGCRRVAAIRARDRPAHDRELSPEVSGDEDPLRLSLQHESDVRIFRNRARRLDREGLLRPRPGTSRHHARKLRDRDDLEARAEVPPDRRRSPSRRFCRRLARHLTTPPTGSPLARWNGERSFT